MQKKKDITNATVSVLGLSWMNVQCTYLDVTLRITFRKKYVVYTLQRRADTTFAYYVQFIEKIFFHFPPLLVLLCLFFLFFLFYYGRCLRSLINSLSSHLMRLIKTAEGMKCHRLYNSPHFYESKKKKKKNIIRLQDSDVLMELNGRWKKSLYGIPGAQRKGKIEKLTLSFSWIFCGQNAFDVRRACVFIWFFYEYYFNFRLSFLMSVHLFSHLK